MLHQIIEDRDTFLSMEQSWNDLLINSPTNDLPLTHSWMVAWWNSFGKKRLLQIHCFYEENVLIAIAPLMKDKTFYRHIPIVRISYMANGHSPFCGLIVRNDLHSDSINRIVCEIINKSAADIYSFNGNPEDSVFTRLIGTRNNICGLSVGYKQGLKTPLIYIDSDWETFFAKRTRKFRKNIKNKVNRFQRTKNSAIQRMKVFSPDDPVLKNITEISKHSWKAKKGADLGTYKNSRQFLYELAGNFGPEGAFEVWLAKIGGKPIAYEMHLVYNNIIYPLRADYDESWRDLSPGSVLEYTALKTLFSERKIKLYDSCANDYWYLKNWTDVFMTHQNIEIFSNSPKNRLLYKTEYKVIPKLRRILHGKKKVPTRFDQY